VTQNLQVHVESAKAMARRFVDAWHRAERGEEVDEHHLSFESWEGLARVLTGKRLELLRHLRRQPVPSIAALARALGRDYKRVHSDVEALTAAGLIDRTPAGLRADYDEIRTTIAI
jgi:predicted transcriptional regulator